MSRKFTVTLGKLTALLLALLLLASCGAKPGEKETAPPFSSSLSRSIDAHYRVTFYPIERYTCLYALAPTDNGYLAYAGDRYNPQQILTLDQDFAVAEKSHFPKEVANPEPGHGLYPCRQFPSSSGVPYVLYVVEEPNYRGSDNLYELRQGSETLFRLPDVPNNTEICAFHLLEAPEGIYTASYWWIALDDTLIELPPTVDPNLKMLCTGLFRFADRNFASFRVDDETPGKVMQLGVAYYIAELTDGKCGELMETAITGAWYAFNDDYVYYFSDNTIFRTDGYQITSCCDLLAEGIDGTVCAAFTEEDRLILLLPNAVAVLEEDDSIEKTDFLTVGLMWSDAAFSNAIADFNREDHGFKVTIRTFDNMTQINLAMASHELDLLGGIHVDDIESRARSGLLEPLGDYLDLGRFYENLVSLGSVNGECYFLPYTFGLHGMVLPEAYVPERGYFLDINELSEALDGMYVLSAAHDVISDPYRKLNTREGMLFDLKSDGFEEFIDREKATCSFDSQEFIDLLTFCNGCAADWDEVEANRSMGQSYFMSNHTLEAPSWVNMLDDFYSSSLPEEEGYKRARIFPIVGTGKYSGLSVFMHQCLAVPAGCPHPEEVKELLNYLYSDTVMKKALSTIDESAFIPVRKVFLEQCQALCKQNDLPVSTASSAANMIAFADHFYRTNLSPVAEIVTEEALRYFAGDISAEQAAKYIQNRVTLLLAEQS